MKTICAIKNVLKALTDFEMTFEKVYQISLNEAIVLCSIKCAKEKLTATQISQGTSLSPSHTSKILRILEEKKLIIRKVGHEDHRQMYFHLSPIGKDRVKELEINKVEIPAQLQPLLDLAEEK